MINESIWADNNILGHNLEIEFCRIWRLVKKLVYRNYFQSCFFQAKSRDKLFKKNIQKRLHLSKILSPFCPKFSKPKLSGPVSLYTLNIMQKNCKNIFFFSIGSRQNSVKRWWCLGDSCFYFPHPKF